MCYCIVSSAWTYFWELKWRYQWLRHIQKYIDDNCFSSFPFLFPFLYAWMWTPQFGSWPDLYLKTNASAVEDKQDRNNESSLWLDIRNHVLWLSIIIACLVRGSNSVPFDVLHWKIVLELYNCLANSKLYKCQCNTTLNTLWTKDFVNVENQELYAYVRSDA